MPAISLQSAHTTGKFEVWLIKLREVIHWLTCNRSDETGDANPGAAKRDTSAIPGFEQVAAITPGSSGVTGKQDPKQKK